MKPHTPGPRVDLPGQMELPDTTADSAGLAKMKAAAPMRPEAAQNPCDFGLFLDGGDQLDLVDLARKTPM